MKQKAIWVILLMLTIANVRSLDGYNGVRFLNAHSAHKQNCFLFGDKYWVSDQTTTDDPQQPCGQTQCSVCRHVMLLDNGATQISEEACVQLCRQVRTNQVVWQIIKTFPLLMCHYNPTNSQCEGSVVEDSNQFNFDPHGKGLIEHLVPDEEFITYVNVIPDGTNATEGDKSGWYWDAKCQASSNMEEQYKSTLEDCLNAFEERLSLFDTGCIHYNPSSNKCVLWHNCQGIKENEISRNKFCYFSNNQIVPNTEIGEAQLYIQGYKGERRVESYCNMADDEHNHYFGQQYTESSCKSECLNFRLHAQYFNSQVYCCEFGEINEYCKIYGYKAYSFTEMNSMTVNLIGYTSFANLIPRNLQKYDLGGSRISTVCQGTSSQSHYVNDFNDCMSIFDTWKIQQVPQVSYCVGLQYLNGNQYCHIYDSCGDIIVKDSSFEGYCLKIRVTSPCTVNPSVHSQNGNNKATIQQSSCFSIPQFTKSNACSSPINYQLKDIEGNDTEDLILNTDFYRPTSLHVCPKNLKNAQGRKFIIKAQVDDVEISEEYEMILSEMSYDGYHTNQGKRFDNSYCETFDWVNTLFIGSEVDESSCLNLCLYTEIEPSNQKSIYCCIFYYSPDSARACGLSGLDFADTRNLQAFHSDWFTSYFGIIPNNIDYKGGWRWDAYCSGTSVTSSIAQDLAGCRQNFIHTVQNELQIDLNLNTSCAQFYKDPSQTSGVCTIFSNCDVSVGSLEGFFCYNPRYGLILEIIAPDLPSVSYQLDELPALYEFQEFSCQNCIKDIVYELLVSTQEHDPTNSGLNFKEIIDPETSSSRQIIVNASSEALIQFQIHAYLEENQDINVTSSVVNITIVKPHPEANEALPEITLEELPPEINFPPFFQGDIPGQVTFEDLNPQNEGVIYQLPEISDENGPENVTITIVGFDSLNTQFDQEAKQLKFLDLNVSKNVSIQISLKDLEDNEKNYDIQFIFLVNQILEDSSQLDDQSQKLEEEPEQLFQFDGNFMKIDEEPIEEEKEKVKDFTIDVQKCTPNGVLSVSFSEDLVVPDQVKKLLIDVSTRLLNSSSDQPLQDKEIVNQTDLYEFVKQAVLVEVQQFDQVSNMFLVNKIRFNYSLIDWTEKSMILQLNFSQPLSISRGTEADRILFQVLDSSLFISQISGKPYNMQNQNPEALKVSIPLQFTPDTDPNIIMDNIQNTKQATLGCIFFQLLGQGILKGSKEKLISVYLSLQLISGIQYFNTGLPTIPTMVLNEMWNLVNFTLMTPQNLLVMFASLFQTMKSKDSSFQSIFEKNKREMEISRPFVSDLSAQLSITIGFCLALLIFLVQILFPYTRQLALRKIRLLKKEMIWNGFIVYFQISFMQQGFIFALQLQEYIQKDFEDLSEFQVFQLIFYPIFLLLPQFLIFYRLSNTDNDVLKSIKSRNIFGALTSQIMLRNSGLYSFEKFYFNFQILYKLLIVMSTIVIIPFGSRALQMILLNLIVFLDFVITLKVDPFDVPRIEKRLRILNQYLISLCFLNVLLYDGKFINGDEPSEDGISEMVFQGLISNEVVHYNYGQVQTCLFLIAAASCLALQLNSFVKLLTLKRLKYSLKTCCLCLQDNRKFKSQKDNMTTEVFDVILERQKVQEEKIQNCVIWASRFEKDVFLKIQRYEKKNGKLHHLNRRFYLNNHRLQQLKYAQIKFVLQRGDISQQAAKTQKEKWRTEINRLLREQAGIHSKGFVTWESQYGNKFQKDYTHLTVYEAVTLMEQEMINDAEKPLEAPRLEVCQKDFTRNKKVKFESSLSSSLSDSKEQEIKNYQEVIEQCKKVMNPEQIQKVKKRLHSKGKGKKINELTDDEDEADVSEEEKVPEKKISFVNKLEQVEDQDLVIVKSQDFKPLNLVQVKTKQRTVLNKQQKVQPKIQPKVKEMVDTGPPSQSEQNNLLLRFMEGYMTKKWAKQIFEDYLKVEIQFYHKNQTQLTRILNTYTLLKANAVVEREFWSQMKLQKGRCDILLQHQVTNHFEKNVKLTYDEYIESIMNKVIFDKGS